MKTLSIFLILSSALFSTTARSSQLPPENLKLVGKANLSIWFWDIYDAELYNTSGQYQSDDDPTINRPLLLKITYNRKISSEDLIEETASQWERFDISEIKKAQWLESLRSIWPSVNDNDHIMFYIDADGFCHFFYNDRYIGSVEDHQFSRHFANIWLARDGPHPDMTSRLIGKK